MAFDFNSLSGTLVSVSKPTYEGKDEEDPQESPAGDHPKQLTDTPHNEQKESQPPPEQTDGHGEGSKPPQESPAGDHPKQLTSTPHNPPKEPQEELHAALKTISEREAASARLKLEQQTLDEARSTVAKLKADHSSRATIFSEVLEAIKKERTSDPSETEVTEISKLIESNGNVIMDTIGNAIIKALEDDKSKSKNGYSP
ncbi:hypothetical protein DL766_010003 [Monosporascus sp. MC13-8B]|nr:hypothetical protein DL763_009756 [Monosporascus cannonballus]RYP11994.1 hypothetical protein DL766_010003 [Monosporascus sp. MC13-8B]